MIEERKNTVVSSKTEPVRLENGGIPEFPGVAGLYVHVVSLLSQCGVVYSRSGTVTSRLSSVPGPIKHIRYQVVPATDSFFEVAVQI